MPRTSTITTHTAASSLPNRKHILCHVQHDYDAPEGMDRTLVGSTRLEMLWGVRPSNPSSELAVINLTYEILTEARDPWLCGAIEGCELAGIPYVVSKDPAGLARTPHPKSTSISASRLLCYATVLISRFSTLPIEAVACGVPFVCYNPHEERVAICRASGHFRSRNPKGVGPKLSAPCLRLGNMPEIE